ncbi:hypothetical protein V502_00498 [Pseudogymnoascus sp. VKM F-4520 (FW-2644)]|nr:hypothetical protein V502_00498 [Pseudogymnoascus sp. VKM F-4520 (FW-2644)]
MPVVAATFQLRRIPASTKRVGDASSVAGSARVVDALHPNTPGSTSNGGFQQASSQPAPRQYYLQPNSSYQQPIQPYSMMPQGSMSMSHPHPQAIAPAPGPTHNRLVPLRPVNPSTPLHAQHPMRQQMQRDPAHIEVPTHVVGSQGRRGILPSASRRPSVAATGLGASKNAQTPAKDADGKFPCPHCVDVPARETSKAPSSPTHWRPPIYVRSLRQYVF